jgi:hypothetical protein
MQSSRDLPLLQAASWCASRHLLRAPNMLTSASAEYRLPGTRWEAVANQMADAWVHFVSRGNPNGAGGESTRARSLLSSR